MLLRSRYTSVLIRPAIDDDAAALSRVHFEAVHRTAAPFYPAEVIDSWSQAPDQRRIDHFRLAIAGRDEFFLVAECDGEVVGFGSIVPSAGELRAVYVHPDVGRMGIGSAILQALERSAMEKGMSALRMDASVNAEAFYSQHGYEVVERSTHQLTHGPQMACVKMQKSLKESRRPKIACLVVFALLAACFATSTASTNPAQVSARFPNFNRQLLLESTSETSANVSIGDLNGDGNLDIVLIKGRHWPLTSRVLLGDGKGHFPSSYNLGDTAYRSYSGRLVDIDADGHPDVVLSNDAPDAKVIYLNDGKGHFRRGSTYGRSEWVTRNVSVADLNGDRFPDIIVANRADNPKNAANYICLNRGRGRFDADCIAFAPYPATTITPADFNRDGRIDLAVPHRDGGQSYVYLVGANAAVSDSQRIPFGPSDAHIRMAEAADFNGDGLLDIVAIDDQVKTVTIYFAKRDGTFNSGITIGDSNAVPYALAVTDLNRDGKIDTVVGYVEAQPTIYFNDGRGRNFIPLRFGDKKGTAYGFAIDDLDHDGVLDIAMARSDAPNVVYFGSREQ